MQNSEKPESTGREKKKHGDFSKFMKKKPPPSRSKTTSKLISKRFRDEEEHKKDTVKKEKIKKKLPVSKKSLPSTKSPKSTNDKGQELIRLNKFISNAGICSRRDADNLIISGTVKVNGEVVSEVGTKILPTDKVQIGEETLKSEKLRYVLLNKPKGYITTTDDPDKRNTVMMLVEKACKERIYPVGRLDRNTTGLLLFTNDGDLARKLTHPRSRVNKTYHVYLNKAVTKNDMKQLEEGIELEDGQAKVDAIAYVGTGADKKDVGVELHSGKNRIVRRLFETLGYEVIKLDRVVFAGLTKKDLPRGRYRMLDPKEVAFLKML
ncbi:MAG: rRNA pseudouridine synthase [Sphingobacteriia bacterium]|nr:rRNA pseudouridine synthase [Sphingobacteriia bacterium]